MRLSAKILEHLPGLSGNGAKLLVWILLSAKQERLEANIDDVMAGLGWSRNTVKRTVKELSGKEYILFEAAANQRARGEIKILKPDIAERDSAQPESEPTRNETIGAKPKPEPGTKSAQPENGPSSVPTTAPTGSLPPKPEPAKPKVAAIDKNMWAGELTDVVRKTLAYIRFEPDKRLLSRGFVSVLEWLGKRSHLPLPGLLVSRIIDRCLLQQRTRKAAGKDPGLYIFPPGLQKHRDTLRRHERQAGKAARAA